MGWEGVCFAGEKLRSNNGLARRAAVEVLGMAGETGAKRCALLVKDGDERVRRLAAEAMGEAGAEAGKNNAAALGALLLDEDCTCQRLAASSLALMGNTGANVAAD